MNHNTHISGEEKVHIRGKHIFSSLAMAGVRVCMCFEGLRTQPVTCLGCKGCWGEAQADRTATTKVLKTETWLMGGPDKRSWLNYPKQRGKQHKGKAGIDLCKSL